jgi:hypothetical protein
MRRPFPYRRILDFEVEGANRGTVPNKGTGKQYSWASTLEGPWKNAEMSARWAPPRPGVARFVEFGCYEGLAAARDQPMFLS